jgi:hypothetical protein
MREVAFIKQNKEKWLGIEHVISGKLKKILMNCRLYTLTLLMICLLPKPIIQKVKPRFTLIIFLRLFSRKFIKPKE